MIDHVNSNILTTSSRVFYLRDIQLHSILYNARRKLRNYVHRSCPVNLSTKAFFLPEDIKSLPWYEFIYLFVNKNGATDIFHFEIVSHGSIINSAQLLCDSICSY